MSVRSAGGTTTTVPGLGYPFRQWFPDVAGDLPLLERRPVCEPPFVLPTAASVCILW